MMLIYVDITVGRNVISWQIGLKLLDDVALALLVEATSARRREMVGECYPLTIRRRITPPPGPKSRTQVIYFSVGVLLL